MNDGGAVDENDSEMVFPWSIPDEPWVDLHPVSIECRFQVLLFAEFGRIIHVVYSTLALCVTFKLAVVYGCPVN